MNTAIILHGTQGSPNGNWFQWLKKELEARGFVVWVPQLPNADKPSLAEWAAFVGSECPFAINKKTLILGHSSGAITALVVAQDNMEKVGAIVDGILETNIDLIDLYSKPRKDLKLPSGFEVTSADEKSLEKVVKPKKIVVTKQKTKPAEKPEKLSEPEADK